MDPAGKIGLFGMLLCFDEKVAALVAALTQLMFCIMIAFMFIQVFTRFILQIALPWCQEMVVYLFMLITFFGSAVAIRNSSHITIDIFVLILNKIENDRTRHLVEILVDIFKYLVILGVCLFVANLCYSSTIKVKMMRQLTSVMQLPKWWIDGGVFLGFSCMVLHSAVQALSSIARLFALDGGDARHA